MWCHTQEDSYLQVLPSFCCLSKFIILVTSCVFNCDLVMPAIGGRHKFCRVILVVLMVYTIFTKIWNFSVLQSSVIRKIPIDSVFSFVCDFLFFRWWIKKKILIVHVGKYGVFSLVIHVLYCTGFDICASLGADIRATCQQMQHYSFPPMEEVKSFLESYADESYRDHEYRYIIPMVRPA